MEHNKIRVEIQNKLAAQQNKRVRPINKRHKQRIREGWFKNKMKEFVAQKKCFGFDLFFILYLICSSIYIKQCNYLSF